MNCMEFQRELNADPHRLSTAALGHAETCADCARRMAGQINIDAQWEAELQAHVPDGMEDRILLAIRMARQKRQRFYAMAASLVGGVALVLGVTLSQPGAQSHDLVALAVDHVLEEPEHLQETRIVDASTLNRLLAKVGAQVNGVLPATYANACILPNGQGGHIVLQTSGGRVTLMLIPNGKTDVMLRRASGNFIVEVHAARHGSYALVAANEAALTDAKALLARKLRWT